MPQSFAAIYLHFIFSTKRRQPLIEEEWQPRLHSYLGGIVRAKKGVLLRAGGTVDHVHLLVSMGRETSAAEMIRVLKSNSSKWIHETQPSQKGFSWQTGYGAFSVSQSQLRTVERYIENQKKHHQTLSYQEEMRAFLSKHGLVWDEKYVWD